MLNARAIFKIAGHFYIKIFNNIFNLKWSKVLKILRVISLY